MPVLGVISYSLFVIGLRGMISNFVSQYDRNKE